MWTRPRTRHLMRRVRELARRIGIPLVLLPDGLEKFYRCHRNGFDVMRHDGPTGDTWIVWSYRLNTPAVVVRHYRMGLGRQAIHCVIHDLAHAWIWKHWKVSPRGQDEYAGFLCVEYAMTRVVGMSGKSWEEWQGSSSVPESHGGDEWASLSRKEKKELFQNSERCVLEGIWERGENWQHMQPYEME